MKSSRADLPEHRVQKLEMGLLGLIALLPLMPLFVPGRAFGADWVSHLWLASYYAEYFKHHLSFPEAINTAKLVGIPYPIFYGKLLYPGLGLASALVGAAWAMRGAVAAVFFLQSWQVFRLTVQAGGDRTFGLVVAAVSCWSTYALTNLYNRSAIGELIAVALLTSAVGTLGRVFLLPPGKRRAADVATGLLWFVLAAGTHSITALCGGLFVAFLAGMFFLLVEERSQPARWALIGGGAAFLVLSPWIYAVARFGSAVQVSKEDSKEIAYLASDCAGSRLMPFPYDSRVAENPAMRLGQTPYLDSQVAIGLLLLAVFLSAVAIVMHRRRASLYRPGVWLMAVFWILFVFLFAVSVTPALGVALLPLLRKIQFVYRLVSYLNLSLLLVVTGGLAALSTTEWAGALGRWRQAVPRFVLGVALLGLFVKLRHGIERAYVAGDVAGAQAVQMPSDFHGWDYAILTRPEAPDGPTSVLEFPVGSGSHFGRVHPVRVMVLATGRVEIRVQPFPWNEVWVDGRPMMGAPETSQTESGVVMILEAGEHDLAYAWRPDPLWQWLERISRATLFLWIVLVLGLAGRKALGRPADPAAAPA